MKFVLLGPLTVLAVLTSACSTLGQRGGLWRSGELSNLNPAPRAMTPPDQAQASSNPVLDDTYLSSQADYHFTMGESLSFEGQSARAIEEYKSTLIYDPKSVHVRLRLAAEYVRSGMVTEAVEQGEIAVEMAPENIDAHMLLGGLYAGLKMYAPARGQFQAILDKEPGHPEAAVYLGALLAEEKQYDESIKYFEALSQNKAFKETEKAYYYIGRVRSEQGPSGYGEATKAFHKALSLRADYPEAALALGMLLRSQGKTSEMEKLLSSFQEKFGPERDMARQLAHHYLEKEDFDKALQQLEYLDGFERDNLNIKIQISLILIEQKRYEAAATKLEDVLLLAPDSDKVRYYLGAVYEELEKPSLAVEHYSKVPPVSPYYADSVIHWAHLVKKQGQLSNAVEIVEGALKKQDEIPQIYVYYATLLDEQKSYRKAASMLDKAVERFPSNTQLRFFLGTMADRLGKTEDTIMHMNKVLELDEDHVQALNYLAYTYAETGDQLDVATKLAERALMLQPSDGYILDTVGWIYFKRGDTERAIRFLEAAHKQREDEAIIAEHLGDAYLRFQMWQKAQRMYQKAASLEKDNVRHRKIQDKIANLQTQQQTPARAPAGVGRPKSESID